MTLRLPPTAPRALLQACGTLPASAALLPDVVLEGSLPDDLIMSAQGIRFEGSNPLPIDKEGDINVSPQQFRVVRVRRSTPEGTVEDRVVLANVGNSVEITVAQESPTTAPATTPVSESTTETLSEETSLPEPDLVTDTSTSSGPSSTEVLQALFAANAQSRDTASAPVASSSFTPSQPVSYSTPSTTYTPAAPVTSGGVSSLEYQAGGASSLTYSEYQALQQQQADYQSQLEQQYLLEQALFEPLEPAWY